MSAYDCPAEITQGTTHAWTVESSDYPPSSGFTLSYALTSERQQSTVAGVQATTSSWTVTLSKAVTAAMFSGYVSWQAFISNAAGTARYLIAEGVMMVKLDLSAAHQTDNDPRTYARKQLEKYNSMMTDMTLVKTLDPVQIEALERVRKQLEWDVKRQDDAERLRAGGYPTRKIFTRFA